MRASVFTDHALRRSFESRRSRRRYPKNRSVVIKVHASAVNFGDTLVRNFKAVSPRKFHMPFLFWLIGRTRFGFTRPRRTVLGSEFAGEIAALGQDVTRFRRVIRSSGIAAPAWEQPPSSYPCLKTG